MTETASEAWARCRGYIEAALEHAGDGWTINDVASGVEAGDFHFWPGAACAVVTEFVGSPRTRVLNFWLLGGSLRELLTMRPHIEAWGVAKGCERAMGGGLCGKRGWARVLGPAGYRPRWIIYSKELRS